VQTDLVALEGLDGRLHGNAQCTNHPLPSRDPQDVQTGGPTARCWGDGRGPHPRGAAGRRPGRERALLRPLRGDARRPRPQRPAGRTRGVVERPHPTLRRGAHRASRKRRGALGLGSPRRRVRIPRRGRPPLRRCPSRGYRGAGTVRLRTSRRLLGDHPRPRRPQPRAVVRPGSRHDGFRRRRRSVAAPN